MFDCTNADVRDSLPDLVNGQLDELSLAAIRAHLVDCASCQQEVALIERARVAILFSTPRVDTQRIISALASTPTPSAARWRMDWKAAAAIALVLAGGAGTYAYTGAWKSTRPTDTLVATSQSAVAPTAAAAKSSRLEASGPELSASGDLRGLTDDQLRALLDTIGKMEALPETESRRVSIPIGSETGGEFDRSGAM